jgi:CHAT domain-containing protein
LASFALRSGDNRMALTQTELSAQLLRPFGALPSAREYKIQNEIVLTSAYLAAGENVKAANTLAGMGRESDGRSVLTRLALHRTRGLLHDQQNDWQQARGELLIASDLARTAARNLSNDASRLQWKREAGLVFRSLTRISLDRERSPESGLAYWEWFRSAPVRQILDRVSPETLNETLRSQLPLYSATTAVSWAQLDDRIAIWLFDDRGVRFAWSPFPASRCKVLCARFTRLCLRPDSDLTTLKKVGQDLYQALLAPIANYLDPGRILLFEPDAVPGAIAFEALVPPDGKWLGDRFTIVTSPGLWAELALRRTLSPLTPSSTALVVGNPLYVSSGSEAAVPLPDAEREAKSVCRRFPSGPCLLGATATPNAVSSFLPQAELFHFAGHARFDGESARMLLSGEGAVLDSRAVENSARRCRLAILSACSTAAPERDDPWNAESLVQAFWRAGTPQVIASRWEVDSAVTAQMFDEFYNRLSSGESAPEALRRAAATIRVQPDKTHPFFWAAFHVFGSVPAERR